MRRVSQGTMAMKIVRLGARPPGTSMERAAVEAQRAPGPDSSSAATPTRSVAQTPSFTGALAPDVATKLLMDIFVEERTGKLVVEEAPNASATIAFFGGEPAHVQPAGDERYAALTRRLEAKGALRPPPADDDGLADVLEPSRARAPSAAPLLALAQRSSPLVVLEALRDEVRDACRAVRDAPCGSWAFYDGDEFVDDTPLTPVNTFGLVLEARRRTMQPEAIMRFASELSALVPVPLDGFANATSRLLAFTAQHDLADVVDGTRRAAEIFDAVRL